MAVANLHLVRFCSNNCTNSSHYPQSIEHIVLVKYKHFFVITLNILNIMTPILSRPGHPGVLSYELGIPLIEIPVEVSPVFILFVDTFHNHGNIIAYKKNSLKP